MRNCALQNKELHFDYYRHPKALPKFTAFRLETILIFTISTNGEIAQDTSFAAGCCMNRKSVGDRLPQMTHGHTWGIWEGCTPSSLPAPKACAPMSVLAQYKRDHFHSSGLFGSNFDITQLGKNDLMKHIL